MNSLMDMETLSIGGVRAVQGMQYSLQGVEKIMEYVTEFGNPATAFMVCFPMAYFINYRLGLFVIWAASLSEWLNGLLKWFLYGERPYWWVGEHRKVVGEINLKQYPATCETGPGSPSGHCMVTAAVWYIVVAYLCFRRDRLTSCFYKSIFFLVMTAVGVSRCFIAAHFPHQVVAGVISGIICAFIVSRSSLPDAWPGVYFIASFFMIGTAFGVQATLKIVGIDPDWTLRLAKQWCRHPEWVNANTNPMAAFIRDSAALFGVGVCLFFLRRHSSLRSVTGIEDSCRIKRFLSCCISTLALLSIHRYIHLNTDESLVVYSFMMLKSFCGSIIVMFVVPSMVSCLCLLKTSKLKDN